MKKNAFVTLLMLDEKYYQGCLVTAYSIILTNKNRNKYDLVCMVTDDISNEIINKLELIYDKIITVPYLHFKSNLLGKKYQNIHKYTYNLYYTKWNCLNLTEYNKIILLDSDIVILKDIMHVFNYNAPAGIFTLPQLLEKQSKYYPLDEGELILPSMVNFSLNNYGSCASANFILIEPNKSHFNLYKEFMYIESNKKNGYGWKTCASGHDEQSITEYYSLVLNKNWTLLPTYYNWINFYPKTLNIVNTNKYIMPYSLHYNGKPKPWNFSKKDTIWDDLFYWYQLSTELNKKYKDKNLKLISFISHENKCWFCKRINELGFNFNTQHNFNSKKCNIHNDFIILN